MAAQHTPGPWSRRQHDEWGVDAPSQARSLSWAAIGTGKRSYPIALVTQRDRHAFGDGDAEHNANLALIAAAPAMLADLRRDLEFAKQVVGYLRVIGDTKDVLYTSAQNNVKRLRAAIAKAEGR